MGVEGARVDVSINGFHIDPPVGGVMRVDQGERRDPNLLVREAVTPRDYQLFNFVIGERYIELANDPKTAPLFPKENFYHDLDEYNDLWNSMQVQGERFGKLYLGEIKGEVVGGYAYTRTLEPELLQWLYRQTWARGEVTPGQRRMIKDVLAMYESRPLDSEENTGLVNGRTWFVKKKNSGGYTRSGEYKKGAGGQIRHDALDAIAAKGFQGMIIKTRFPKGQEVHARYAADDRVIHLGTAYNFRPTAEIYYMSLRPSVKPHPRTTG